VSHAATAARAGVSPAFRSDRRLLIKRRAISRGGDCFPDGVSLARSDVFINTRAGDSAIVRATDGPAVNGGRAESGFSHAKQIILPIHQFSTVRFRPVVSLGRDSHLEDPIPLMAEEVVGLLDLVELLAMRDERTKINLP
jgi:hypothetical protein